MKRLKTVGVKDLKNNLSAYLREVRSGTKILVSDRSDIVAELHEPYGTVHVGQRSNPILDEWVSMGTVLLPTAKKSSLPVSPVKLPSGTAAGLLNSDREETRE